MLDKQGLYLGNVTDAEAKEFHGGFMLGMFVFVGVAVVAHYLVWLWRPWLTNAPVKTADLHHAVAVISALLT